MQKKKKKYPVLCILSQMFLRNSEVNPCSKTITNENCPFHPSPRLNDYLVSRRHKKSLHSTYTCPSVCLYMCLLCHDSPSVLSFSPTKFILSPSSCCCCWPAGYDSCPPPQDFLCRTVSELPFSLLRPDGVDVLPLPKGRSRSAGTSCLRRRVSL